MEQSDGLVLELPRSGLLVAEGAIFKRSPRGVLTGRHQFHELADVRVDKRIDPIVIAMCVFTAGLAVLCKVTIASLLWGWGLAGFFGLVCLACLFSIQKFHLLLTGEHGDVSYELLDPPEECTGFVVTLKSLLNEREHVSHPGQSVG